MPVIRPFKGLRYDPVIIGDMSRVVAPPYDIIYDEWRDRLYERNPYNIIRLIKTREESGDNENHNRYTRARDYEQAWVREGILKYDEKPALYVRSETYGVNGMTKTRFGFIALVKVEEFGRSIHPHERTLSAPKADRLNLVKATGTNFSQIFSIFSDPDHEIQKILLEVAKGKPEADFVDEQGITRKIWIVDDKTVISRLAEKMKSRDIIIADGHHRYETSLAYKEFMEPTRRSDDEAFDYVSMYLSSGNAEGMTILPTHRKVGQLHGFDGKAFLRDMSREFDLIPFYGATIEEMLDRIKADSAVTNVFGLYLKDVFYIARMKAPAAPKLLDVDVLHDSIIEKKLGITKEDIAQGLYLHFSKSPEHAYEDVARGKDQAAFFMNALTTEEMFREVLKGRRMPQKSTYFYPKTLSGLVMYKIGPESLG